MQFQPLDSDMGVRSVVRCGAVLSAPRETLFPSDIGTPSFPFSARDPTLGVEGFLWQCRNRPAPGFPLVASPDLHKLPKPL